MIYILYMEILYNVSWGGIILLKELIKSLFKQDKKTINTMDYEVK